MYYIVTSGNNYVDPAARSLVCAHIFYGQGQLIVTPLLSLCLLYNKPTPRLQSLSITSPATNPILQHLHFFYSILYLCRR